ncbi:uncharacterized protein At4g26485-like [Rhodamnia argentea]|uniref:Uncharacterized protein At4g26485-like n=1 Tax=Rhodamnia argentea TaxID=178133 RepID=A0ABM3GYG5_9MYRT|nr:uncharacterized protein At4g26485-like [Rhodamnia argentea]
MAEANLDGNGYVGPEKRIKHYSNLHRILLVGEGDFSFAACLARKFGDASNMVATSLDSRGMIWMRYASSAIDNLDTIDGFWGTVLHDVDAHTMSKHPSLKHKSFDRIVYNFPHAGFHGPEASSLQIELHQDLVRGFLNIAKAMLAEDGEIHVTHKTGHPYSKWGIEKLAEEQGLFLVEETWFSARDYARYVNQRGSGVKCHHTFPVGEASTYKFRKSVSVLSPSEKHRLTSVIVLSTGRTECIACSA